VDTGSTDNTVSIAQELGARTFSFPFSGDLAEARNFSIDKACNNWVLIIDADERIASEDYEKIESLIEKDDVDGYRVIIRNYAYDSSIEGWVPNDNKYPDYAHLPGFFAFNLVRLFRKDSGIRYKGVVHETNEETLRKKNIVQSPVVIHHLGRLDKGEIAKKDQLYIELGHRKIQADPENPRVYYELAKQYSAIGQWQTAFELLSQAMSYSKDDPDILFEYALALQKLEKIKQSIEIYKRLLNLRPDHFGALVNLGVALKEVGHLDDAEYFLNMASSIRPFHPAPPLQLGIIMLKRGMYPKAVDLLRSAFEMNPHDPSPLPHLAECCIQMGHIEDARQILNLMKTFPA